MLDLMEKCSKFVSQECGEDDLWNANFVPINAVFMLANVKNHFWQALL